MTNLTDFKEFRDAIFLTLMSKVEDKLEAEHENISNSLLQSSINTEINSTYHNRSFNE